MGVLIAGGDSPACIAARPASYRFPCLTLNLKLFAVQDFRLKGLVLCAADVPPVACTL